MRRAFPHFFPRIRFSTFIKPRPWPRLVVFRSLVPNRRDEAERLAKRLSETDAYLLRLQRERADAQRKLALLRAAEVTCPKCGRDHDFLTDEGGYLAHVLEDASDQELLSPGKPLYCPTCGEVFLYRGGARAVVAPASKPRTRSA